jgi:hypothetical protein
VGLPLPPVGVGLPLPPLVDSPPVDVLPAMGGTVTCPVPLSPPELHAKLAEKIPDRRRTEESGRDLSIAEPLEHSLETEFRTLSIFN